MTELAHDLRGHGAPVLLIHGVLGRIEVWDPVVADLSTSHRTLAYDRRGHGRSPRGTGDVRRHADDAATLIDEVLGEPATVVGWSAGASVGLTLALGRPDLVTRLVMIEPPWHWMLPPTAEFLGQFLAVRWEYLRRRDRTAAEAFLHWVFQRRSGGSDWDTTPDDLKELVLQNAAGARSELRPNHHDMMLNHLPARTAATCSVATSFLLGDESHSLFHRSHRSLSAALPMMTTVRVPGATHLLPVTHPATVASAVRAAT